MTILNLNTEDAQSLHCALTTVLQHAMLSPSFTADFKEDEQFQFFALLKMLCKQK